MAWAARHPGRVARIVVLNTAAFRRPEGKPLPWQLAWIRLNPLFIPVGALLGPLVVRGLDLFVRGSVRRCVARPLLPEVAEQYLRPGGRSDRRAVLRFVQDIPLKPSDRSYGIVAETQEKLGQFKQTPVLILSARHTVDDRVKGLQAGGDDYLPKPYAFSELLARVEVLGRRKGTPEQDMVYRVGDLELDRLSHSVRRQGKEIPLQPREFRLLEYLMKNAGQVVTRTMLLENVWDYHFDPQTNVIDVHVSRLRSKNS